MKILTYEDLSTLVDYQKEKIAKIESAWQDAELRAEKAEANLEKVIAYWEESTMKLLTHGHCYLPPLSILAEWKKEVESILKGGES